MLSSTKIISIDDSSREQAIELINEFFKKVNGFVLDGIFKIKPKAAAQMTDAYLKLSGSGKVLFVGLQKDKQLVSLIIARIEERPYLQEEKIVYIDLAVTKNGHQKKGYMNQLLVHAEEWTKKKKIQIIELRALTENTDAIKYWRNRRYNDFYIRFRKSL